MEGGGGEVIDLNVNLNANLLGHTDFVDRTDLIATDDLTKTVKTERLKAFIESEGKSCSFDPEVIVVNCSWLMIHCYD